MKKGDKIIWDSGFGYDLGYYIGKCEFIYNNVMCKMVSGVCNENSYSKDEVIPYTEKKHKRMNNKYPHHSFKSF